MPAPLTMLCLVLLAASAAAFNVDTHNYVTHRGNPGSMFGFSVASHRERSNSWLLVGAPEAQTSQPGVTRGGAVYRCDIGRSDACSLIEFDKSGNNNSSDGNQIDQKSYQWFGATVRSSGQDGVILACAPRYIWYSTTTHTRDRRDPVGTCWTAKNQFSDFAEFSPCRTKNWGYHRQGSCQAGLGASVSKDGKRLYIGAVGSWYWQGQLHSVDSLARLPFVPPRFYTIIDEGQVISQHIHARPDVISSNEGPLTDDDSYLGYSVAVGDFGGKSGSYQDVAVGMPRGQGLLGKVVLFTWNMTNIVNVTGQQLGAYFGYSLCSADVDGDGRDDLIVGAPLYTDLNNNKGHYETGRIYVIYQGINEETAFQENVEWRDGINSRGRFGLALTALGDINLDGFQDFAVGAPYDGPHGRGAVYIYHGSARGVRTAPAQIINAEQVAGQPYTFGFSLAGGMDLDDNQYPDLIVGAYLSDTAVFLRARPVVRTEASLVFSGQSKQISLEEKNCSLRDGTKVVCFELNSCLKYTGIGVDKRIEFEIEFHLDTKKSSPRMFFMSDEKKSNISQTVRLDKDIQFCKKMSIYMKTNVRDKLTTLEGEMRFGLKGAEPSATRSISRHLSAVLDTVEEPVRRDSLIIHKDCGSDSVCIPNLRLIASPSVKQYLLGSGEKLAIDVEVQNEGEDAFEASFDLMVPTTLNYVKIERPTGEKGKDIPILCSAPNPGNNNTLHCDIGNPLPKEKLIQFKVLLQPHRLESMAPRYEFHMSVNSTNPEQDNTLSDNLVYISVPIWVETDLILQGSSIPTDVHYNASLYDDWDEVTQDIQIGPQVTHTYSIRNKGPSTIIEAEAVFYWPANTLSGDHLLYLLEQPEVSGNIRCDVVEQVNVEKVSIEKRKKLNYDATFESLHSSQGLGSTGSLSDEERRKLGEVAKKREHKESQTHYTSNGGKLESGSRLGGGQNRSWSRESSWTGDGAHGYNQSWGSESSWSSGGESGSVWGDHSRPQAGREHTGYASHGGGYSSEGSRVITGTRTETRDHHQTGSGTSQAGRGYGSAGSWESATRTESRESHRGSGSGHSGTGSARGQGSVGVETSHTRTEHREGHRGSGSGHSGAGSARGHATNEGETGYSRSESRESHRGYNSGSSRGIEEGTGDTSITRTENGGSHRGSSHSGRGYETRGRESSITRTDSRESHRGSGDSGVDRQSGRDRSWSDRETGIRTSEERWRESQSRTASGDVSRGGTRQGNWREETRGSADSDQYRPRTQFEERTYERNSTWNSRDRKPQVSTSWSVNRDGVVESGSSQGEDDVENREQSYFGGRGTGYNATWMASGERTGSGTGQRGRDHYGTGRTHSEERNIERNTTWSDSEGPITSEHSSWRIDEDGKVTNGSTSRVFPGRDRSVTVHTIRPKITVHRTSGEAVDHNLLDGVSAGGGKFYSEDREVHQNTTWSSATGGKPVTHESRHWRINEDGVVSNGSTSDVYEGEPNPVGGIIRGGSSEMSHSGSGSSSRQHGHSSESHSQGHFTSQSGQSESHRHSQGAMGSSSSDSSMSRGSGREHEEVHRRRPVNVNIGDMMNRRNQGQGLGNQAQGLDLGSIAQGPRDGVARTHTFDLGILDSARQEGRQTSSREEDYRSGTQSATSEEYGSRQGSFSSSSHGSSRGHSGHSASGGYSSSRESSSNSHGSSRGHSGHSGSGGYSSSRESSSSSHGGSGSSYSSSSRSEGQGSRGFSAQHNEGDGGMHGSSRSSSSSRSWSYSSTSGTADGDQTVHGGMYAPRSTRHVHQSHHRHTRQVDEIQHTTELECRTTNCAKVRCIVGPLQKEKEAFVTFKSRLWVNTLKQLTSRGEVSVSSMVVATVTQLPHIGRPDMDTTRSFEVFTRLLPRSAPVRPEVVPLWVFVLSACAGALLLMLLVYLLYKVGFFKRNRPSSSPEKQPLNRNGHYQPGDEAL